MERPEEFADTSVLTEKEVAEFVASATERGQAARLTRPGGEVGPEAWAALGAQLTEDRRTSLIVDPADGKIPPLLPDAQGDFYARQAAKTRPVRERVVYGSVAQGPEDLGLSERCILGFNTGPPLSGTGYNTKVLILQRPDYVVLLNEMVHDARIIPLDGMPHLSQEIRQWRGDPRGFWDGETLVVDSTHFTDKIASFDKVFWKAVGSGESLPEGFPCGRPQSRSSSTRVTRETTRWSTPSPAHVPKSRPRAQGSVQSPESTSPSIAFLIASARPPSS